MAMLLRTRQRRVALGLRICVVLAVSAVYVCVGVLQKSEDTGRSDIDISVSSSIGRRLLSINATTSPVNTTEVPKEENCTPAAINEFPRDGFTRSQRQHGWIAVHVLLACYFFTLLAVVCDDYFVPAVKKFSDSLHLKEDVAGATFMAIASSSPELFINSVGTFVTEGDLGLGTVVGSAVFNLLAVSACCGLFTNMVLDLEWWPVTRDTSMYASSVVLLIVVLQDGKIYFYEALTLVLFYSFYILIMCYNNKLSSLANKLVTKFKKRSYYRDLTESHPLLFKMNGKYNDSVHEILDTEMTLKDCEDLEESTKIWEWPSNESRKGQAWWVITWPISFCLYLTTPDCRKYPKTYVLTFLMCIFWISVSSYMVAWLITVIGDTINIPDSVMGLTFLAAGTSVPEAVSSVIVTNLGHGSMGISSSIGSNTFDILLCLGIPWLIKTSLYSKSSSKQFIKINSAGINYSAGLLLSIIFLLYISMAFNRFKIDWKVGLVCLVMYLVFLVVASLIEMNVFVDVNLPTCDR